MTKKLVIGYTFLFLFVFTFALSFTLATSAQAQPTCCYVYDCPGYPECISARGHFVQAECVYDGSDPWCDFAYLCCD